MTNVAKILLLQVFFNIRRKLFDFQTFMNETHIINSTDIIIYFTDTYYLYYQIDYVKRSSQSRFSPDFPETIHSIANTLRSVWHSHLAAVEIW